MLTRSVSDRRGVHLRACQTQRQVKSHKVGQTFSAVYDEVLFTANAHTDD